jgi:hypothetical protein
VLLHTPISIFQLLSLIAENWSYESSRLVAVTVLEIVSSWKNDEDETYGGNQPENTTVHSLSIT